MQSYSTCFACTIDVGYAWAAVISTTVSATVAFIGNRLWTWRNRSSSSLHREYLLYAFFNAVGLLISLGCLWISHDLLGAWQPAIFKSLLADNIAKYGFGLVLGTAFRFWAYRRYVFAARPSRRPRPDARRRLRRDRPESPDGRIGFGAVIRARPRHGHRRATLCRIPCELGFSCVDGRPSGVHLAQTSRTVAECVLLRMIPERHRKLVRELTAFGFAGAINTALGFARLQLLLGLGSLTANAISTAVATGIVVRPQSVRDLSSPARARRCAASCRCSCSST